MLGVVEATTGAARALALFTTWASESGAARDLRVARPRASMARHTGALALSIQVLTQVFDA